MLAAILRVLFYLSLFFVFRLLFRALTGAGSRASRFSGRSSSPRETARGTMVKDPVCGTYLDPSLAITHRRGGDALYFCSQQCQRTYLERQP